MPSRQPPRSSESPFDLPYRPRDPQSYRPGIGLVGCGGITGEHLTAYRAAGYRVLALCDLDQSRCVERRQEFFPQADIYTDHAALLAREEIEVVDIATHPPERPPLIEAALLAGKHVLSQKPYVEDLAEGEALADLADAQGVRLAVNQNGRFAPHFSYLRHAVASGLLGELASAHFRVHWDHSWVKGTPFEQIRHLILYDFAIHWFDILTVVMRQKPTRVFASMARSSTQEVKPALYAQAVVEYPRAQASLAFDGRTAYAKHDTTFVTGSEGTLRSAGPNLRTQQVELTTSAGQARPTLEGTWFPDGFHGAMAELLCAIEEGREPTHSARNNLASLELCFAAVASAERGAPVEPGSVRALPAEARRPP